MHRAQPCATCLLQALRGETIRTKAPGLGAEGAGACPSPWSSAHFRVWQISAFMSTTKNQSSNDFVYGCLWMSMVFHGWLEYFGTELLKRGFVVWPTGSHHGGLWGALSKWSVVNKSARNRFWSMVCSHGKQPIDDLHWFTMMYPPKNVIHCTKANCWIPRGYTY